MADTAPPQHSDDRAALHLHISPLLLVSVFAAIITTGAVGLTAVLANQPGPPPPQGAGSGGGPGGPGGPPPDHPGTIAFMICLGLCVIAWVAVLVAFSRDQVLRRIAASTDPHSTLLTDLRSQLDELKRTDSQQWQQGLDQLEARVTAALRDYGEGRETEGYLSGMRAATSRPDVRAPQGRTSEVRSPDMRSADTRNPDMRALRRVPPAD